MNQSPRLTIGMPVYNGEAFIGSTLQCLLGQTFGDFEIIVCDNASTDKTVAIVEEIARRDPRVRLIANTRNIGANANFSKVAANATAPYFKWAAHDDLYGAEFLARCIAALDADPGVVLAHADSVFIDEAGRNFSRGKAPGEWIEAKSGASYFSDPIDLGEAPTPIARFRQVLFSSLWGTHMFGVIRTSALRQTHLIQNVPNSDRPLLAELALLGRFKGVRQPLFLKRFHSRMTLALTEQEIQAYVSADGEAYSKRRRQLSVFLSTPAGKPVGWLTRNACRGLVLAYSLEVARRWWRGTRHPAICPALETAVSTTNPAASPSAKLRG
ncbi:MAG: glycosyltransferase family 2 protein [Hyphomicrobiaceae bacterium]